MFLAPCTLPIVPGYLAFIAGNPSHRPERARWRLFYNAVAFVAGFSLVFIAFGVFAASLGALLGQERVLIGRAAGVLIILFGLVMLGALRVPGLSAEWHMRLPKFLTLGRWESSFLIGMLFSVGWSPCVGPILGSVLYLASTSATAGQGALLLAVFSLGMGLPFILVALFMSQLGTLVSRAGKLTHVLSVAGALVLISLGVLMLTGNMGVLVAWGLGHLDGFYSHLLNHM